MSPGHSRKDEKCIQHSICEYGAECSGYAERRKIDRDKVWVGGEDGLLCLIKKRKIEIKYGLGEKMVRYVSLRKDRDKVGVGGEDGPLYLIKKRKR